MTSNATKTAEAVTAASRSGGDDDPSVASHANATPGTASRLRTSQMLVTAAHRRKLAALNVGNAPK